jgi:hypothetical protein
MHVITESNTDCSFMQTIIRLPQAREDLKSVNLNPTIIEQLSVYRDFTDQILQELAGKTAITDFISNCKEVDQIYYVKIFPDNEPDSEETREYICYGEYHRNLAPGHQNLLFRIDQNWDEFQFPRFESDKITQAFQKYIPLLSGTVSDPIFPAVYLEQKELNDKAEFLRYEAIDKSLLDTLYLFSIDYWGNALFLDQAGNLFEFRSQEGRILPSEHDLISWTKDKLEELFGTV